eukprot:24719_1
MSKPIRFLKLSVRILCIKLLICPIACTERDVQLWTYPKGKTTQQRASTIPDCTTKASQDGSLDSFNMGNNLGLDGIFLDAEQVASAVDTNDQNSFDDIDIGINDVVSDTNTDIPELRKVVISDTLATPTSEPQPHSPPEKYPSLDSEWIFKTITTEPTPTNPPEELSDVLSELQSDELSGQSGNGLGVCNVSCNCIVL